MLMRAAEPLVASGSIKQHATAVGDRPPGEHEPAAADRTWNRILERACQFDIKPRARGLRRQTEERHVAESRHRCGRLPVFAIRKPIKCERVRPYRNRMTPRIKSC